LALLILIGWLYASILARLFLQWVGPHHDPNFEHGIFVPLFALFVLWRDRKKLQPIAPAPSWAGLPLVALSLLMLVLGELGAELFSSRVSLLILLAGLIILFQGWTFFRAVLFPWAFLILMVPIPRLILQQVTFPLQLQAAKLATALLELVGVPVLRQGNVIVLASMPLNVAEACSGIRSLLTLVTLAIIYGYLMETRMWVRVVLACFAVPIAVAANSFRIFGTGLVVQYWDPDKAEGFFHGFEGWLIFVVALIMLFAVHRVILLIWKGSPVAQRDLTYVKEQPAGEILMKPGLLRFGIAAVLMLGTAIGIQVLSYGEVFPPRKSLTTFPVHLRPWTGTDVPIEPDVLDILGRGGEYLSRNYHTENDSEPGMWLFIAYYPSQRVGETPHSPQHCWPGSGYTPIRNDIITVSLPGHAPFPANRYLLSKGTDQILDIYWSWAHDRAVASEYSAKYHLIIDSIKMHRSDGALIEIVTGMYPGETVEAAQQRIIPFAARVAPLLHDYVPH
jgi:exosortase D (VPLPA-CTERM-specific)